MRLIVILILITSLQVFGEANAQKVTITVKDAPLKEVFNKISDQTGYHFFFRDAILQDADNVELDIVEMPLNEAIEICLGSLPVDYSILDNTIVLKTRERAGDNTGKTADKQQDYITIIGTVTDDEGESLPGVTIVAQGTQIATTTDVMGNYSLKVPPYATTIVFSFVGMNTQEVEIEGRTVINVVLASSVTGIDEVIITAYGTAKRGSFTGAVAQVSSEKLKSRSATDFSSLIQGAGPGIMVGGQTGQPGQVMSIRVRGFGSYGASQEPIILVDGVIFKGVWSAINPNDIESITVLKDAASTALYGNKAANGVVIITTKRGKAGAGGLSFNASYGVITRAIPEYDRIDAFDYFPVMWEAYRNGMAVPGVASSSEVAMANTTASNSILGLLGNYNPFNVPNNQILDSQGKINQNASYKGDYEEALDWLSALTRMGNRQKYDLSYSGGNGNKLDYYVSAGFNSEQGYVIESNLKRFSGNTNINYQATDWFKTGFNVRGSVQTMEWVNALSSTLYANPIRFSRYVGPIYPVWLLDRESGRYILDDNGNRQYDLYDTRGAGANPGRHPIAEQIWDNDLDEITSIAAKTYAEIDFLKNFKFTANVSLDERYSYNTWYKNPIIGDGQPLGRSDKTFSRISSINLNQLLTYTRRFDKHNVEALLGHESYIYKYSYMYGSKANQVVDDNQELINFVDIRSLSSYITNYNSEGYFSRINYDFDSRYFISGSYRRDGSSSFSPANRWGNFWSLGGAWRIDRESFIQDFGIFNMLKLRASYGQVGNDSGIGFYASQALYGLGYNNQSEAGIYQTKLAAEDLVWESSNSTDIALEYAILNHRIKGSVGYYHRVSDNLIFSVPLPLSTGMDSRQANIGTLLNEGFEVEVSVDAISTYDFVWNIAFDLSTLRNVFLKLPQEEIISGTKKLMVGKGMLDFWLREYYGVDPDDGAVLYYASDDVPEAYKRVKGSDILSTSPSYAKFSYVGSAIPDVFGSLSSTLSYKGFELRALFTYSIGGKCFDDNWASLMNPGDYGGAKSADILRRWQKPGDITDVPRMDDAQVSNFNASSTRWLIDASYLSLKNLSLSYGIPQGMSDRLGISYARVFVNGENIFLKSARRGLDPQMNFSGVTSNVFSPNRVISVGLSANF